jgi:hypothetical protein
MIELEDIEKNVDAEVFCLHCDGHFPAYTVRVLDHHGTLQCPSAGCDGGFLDLSFDPWWRSDPTR